MGIAGRHASGMPQYVKSRVSATLIFPLRAGLSGTNTPRDAIDSPGRCERTSEDHS
jgi:hypothetical protein